MARQPCPGNGLSCSGFFKISLLCRIKQGPFKLACTDWGYENSLPFSLEYLHGFPSPLTPPSRSAMVHVNSYLSDRFGNLDMELYCRAERIKSRRRGRETLYDERLGMKSIRARFKRSPRSSRVANSCNS